LAPHWSDNALPYDWTVDPDAQLIVVRGHGDGTTADTLRLIAELADTVRRTPNLDFLYDSVELRIQSSPADMMRVANALFRDVGARFRRFAIVVPPSRVALARIFAALAHPFGVTANVFADQESAREWLAARSRERGPDPDPGPSLPRP
jgi:hypothetical protein